MQTSTHPLIVNPAMNDHQALSTTETCAGAARFVTTRWSVVLQLWDKDSPQAEEALNYLCRTYWYPLYAYARRGGLNVDEAKDATQSFFQHMLGKSLFARADPQRGRFRSFLLTCFKNHVGQQRRKRPLVGGGAQVFSLDETEAEQRYQHEPVDPQSPDLLYERRWAVTQLEKALEQLEAKCAAEGEAAQFAAMKPFLIGDQGDATYRDLGRQLGTSEGAARVRTHRLRERYRESLRQVVAQTVSTEEEILEELRHILEVLSR